MKKLLVLLAVLGVGFPLIAEGVLVGVEIVPHSFGHATFGVPYFQFGYDTGWAFATAGTSSPLTISSWYEIAAGGELNVSSNWRFVGGASVWGNLADFSLADGRWSFFVGGSWLYEGHFDVFFRLHVPYRVDPDVPFMGAWLTLGFDVYPWVSGE